MEISDPAERVAYAISMTDLSVLVCAASIKDQNPTITDKELILQIRKRILYRRNERHGV